MPKTLWTGRAAFERRHAILRAYDAGAKVVDIAQRVDLSTQRVYQCLHRARKERDLGLTKFIQPT